MKLVKRDANNNVICAYEVFSFRVDTDRKTVAASITKYTIGANGVPFAEDLSYVLFDGSDVETTIVSMSKKVPKRNPDGSLVFDEKGNPLFQILEDEKVSVTTPVEVKEFTIFTNTISTMGLLDGCKQAILSSFQKQKLKDETFRIEI